MPDAHDVCRVVEQKVVNRESAAHMLWTADSRLSNFNDSDVQGRLSALALSLSRVAVEPAVLSSIPSRTFLPIEVSLGSAIG